MFVNQLARIGLSSVADGPDNLGSSEPLSDSLCALSTHAATHAFYHLDAARHVWRYICMLAQHVYRMTRRSAGGEQGQLKPTAWLRRTAVNVRMPSGVMETAPASPGLAVRNQSSVPSRRTAWSSLVASSDRRPSPHPLPLDGGRSSSA